MFETTEASPSDAEELQQLQSKFGFKDTGEIIPFFHFGQQSGFDHIFVLDRNL
jgi:hypothetical protein